MLRKIFGIIYFLSLCSLLEGKPHLWIFLGPEGCPWSPILNQNVLSDGYFKEKMEHVIDLTVFPFSNQKVREENGVTMFPTLLLVSTEGERWAEIPFVPLDAEDYVQRISEMVIFKQSICVDQVKAYTDTELKEHYDKALHLGFRNEVAIFLAEGLKRDRGIFFLLEKYRNLVQLKRMNDPELILLKEQIKKRDMHNQRGAHLQLALMDYEAREKKNKSLEKTLEPLIAYVQNFKKEDPENIWRIEWLMARAYLKRNQKQGALQHSAQALTLAPNDKKVFVQEFIDSFSRL